MIQLLLGSMEMTIRMNGTSRGALERQGYMHIKVEIQSNSEFQSLTSSPNWSPEPSRLQFDLRGAHKIRFGCSTYAWQEDEINFAMALLPCPTRIGFDQNCRKN
jgi:hypothetical protein